MIFNVTLCMLYEEWGALIIAKGIGALMHLRRALEMARCTRSIQKESMLHLALHLRSGILLTFYHHGGMQIFVRMLTG